jgi:hypothetical protein
VPSQDPFGAQIVNTDEDMPVSFVVAAVDIDDDPLTYSVVIPPAHGALNGTLPSAAYQPSLNYNGPDSFIFAVSDGIAEVTGTVRIEVVPINDPPVAASQSVSTDVKSAITITLAAVDVEGDPLVYRLVTGPLSGTLTGTPPQVVYLAGGPVVRHDQLTFVADDGQADSNLATVSITVTAAPVGLDVVPEPAIFDPRLFLPAINLDR